MLPRIIDAVGAGCEVLLDGGVRRGADIDKARALGGRGVLIGRPYLWGLAAGGEAGVAQILRLFRQSASATLVNLDVASMDALDASVLVLRVMPARLDLPSKLPQSTIIQR